jgi:anthranilate phosphoribosyltransferase
LRPEEAGLEAAPVEAIRGGDAVENARMAQGVLDGEGGARRDVVLLNAAAALLVAGRAGTLREGVATAASAIDAGRARALLVQIKEVLSA